MERTETKRELIIKEASRLMHERRTARNAVREHKNAVRAWAVKLVEECESPDEQFVAPQIAQRMERANTTVPQVLDQAEESKTSARSLRGHRDAAPQVRLSRARAHSEP